jgi:uncharacterized membrane protein
MEQKSAKKLIGIMLFPLFCLLFSFFILMTDPAYTYLFLENPQSIQPTKQLFKYFAGTTEMPQIFNQEERNHLEDVAMVMRGAFLLLIFVTLALLYLKQRQTIKQGTILLLIITALTIIVPFDALFTGFHKLVFPQGGWIFSPESTLIQFYPIELFATSTISIIVHALITAFFLNYLEIVSRRG